MLTIFILAVFGSLPTPQLSIFSFFFLVLRHIMAKCVKLQVSIKNIFVHESKYIPKRNRPGAGGLPCIKIGYRNAVPTAMF